MSKKENYCVWFSDLSCPIRTLINDKQKIDKTILPKDDALGISSMMSNMMERLPMDLVALPAYCNICHLRKKKLETC